VTDELSVFIGALVAACLMAIGVAFWRRPLATLGWLSRRALRRAGLRQQFVETRAAGRQSVWVGGTGPLLVLMHGAGDQAGTWARIIPDLLPHHRLAVPDLPGHGDSEPAGGPLSVGTIRDGVVEMLADIAGDEPAVLVGNSLGAWVAMLLALRQPAAVRRLVLVNGGALKGERTDITFTPATRQQARATVEALMGASASRTPGFILDDVIRVGRFGPLGRLSQTAGEMEPFVLEGRLHEIQAPVDLLWGEDDRVFPIAYADAFAVVAALEHGGVVLTGEGLQRRAVHGSAGPRGQHLLLLREQRRPGLQSPGRQVVQALGVVGADHQRSAAP